MSRAHLVLALALAPAAAAQTAVVITEVCPFAATAGSPDTLVSIRGTGFDYPNLTVDWLLGDVSVRLPVQAFIPGPSFLTLQVLVPARLLAQPGSATIAVNNTRRAPVITSFTYTVGGQTGAASVNLSCAATDADLILVTGPAHPSSGFTQLAAQSVTSPLNVTVVPPGASTDYLCTATAAGFPPVSRAITVTLGVIGSTIPGSATLPPGTTAGPAPTIGPVATVPPASTAPPRAAVTSFVIVAAPALTGVNPPTAVEATPLSLALTGTSFFPALGSCTPGTTATWDDLDMATSVSSPTRLLASVPPSLVTPGTHRVRVVSPGGIGSATLTVTVARAVVPPSISTSFLPDGIVGQPYRPTTVSATTSGLRWSLTPDIGLRIDPATGVVSGTPTTDGQFDITVRGDDPATGASASRTFPVSILPAVSITLTGLPPTIANRGSQTVVVTMARPYPTDVRAQLGLRFDAETGVAGTPPVRDPALQFASNPPGFVNGDVLIPAGATTVRAPLQTGSVAGVITTELTGVSVNGSAVALAPIAATARIPSGPPTISSCIEERSPGLLRIRTVGFSSTREVQSATFRFASRAGREVTTPEIRADNLSQTLFGPYYSSQFADFDYRQDFRVEGELDAIESVTVTLTNARGTSAPAVAAGDCRSLP